MGDDPEEEVTVQTVAAPTVASKAMPAPCSVMAMPALAAAVMAWVGVNENVAVVAVAFTAEVSVIEGPLIAPQSTAGAIRAKMAQVKVIAFIALELLRYW